MTAAHTQWSEFTRHVRATYRDGAEHSEHHLVRAVTQPDFLLIDEIKDDLSDSSRRLLTDILMARDNALRPTIITANLTPEELEDALEQRGSDRFRARCMDVVFDGPKYRDTEGSSVAELKKTILLEATREKGMAQA
jgi:DNA replication protein DnaC